MFHVFVEGASDASPEGIQRLADGMAAHYGLPSADLRARIAAGRFRVKGNVDRATAETYVRDLQTLGARCTIEEANAANSRPTPLPFAAQQPPPAQQLSSPQQPPPASSVVDPVTLRPQSPLAGQAPSRPSAPPSALAGQAPSRPSAPPSALANMPRAATPPPVAGAFSSGLAAAFTAETPATALGALERDNATFSLSSVDGADGADGGDESAIEKSPEPAFGVPASIGPAMGAHAGDAAKAKAKAAKPKDVPVDMFAPPDADDDNLAVEIADDDKDFARKRTSTPAAATPVVADGGASQPTIPTRAGSQPSIPTRASTDPAASSSARLARQPAATSLPSKLGPLANERVRTIAGVVLAILIGFVPAHFIARSREASTYRDLDARLVSLQTSADTPEAYATLDKTRADFLERKHEERRNIAMMALAIWALVGGGIAYGWFRRVPWDDL